MLDYIKQQLEIHPGITPQDVLKMCFQAAFGAEHLLTNIDKAADYFNTEFESIQLDNFKPNEEIFEAIAPDVCRVNMAAWKMKMLPKAWLFQLFVESAGSAEVGGKGDTCFYEYIDAWKQYAKENTIGFTEAELANALENYLTLCGDKLQAVHHSQRYRDMEKPAYRIVSGWYTRLIPILANIPLAGGIIAIDGMAASGKTTIAAALQKILDAEIIPMDDFFLPKDLRTDARLKSPGGNIHYERFMEEVVTNLVTNPIKDIFNYQVFDCSVMNYVGVKTVAPKKWIIVEGTYSHHPYFDKYMSLKVFSGTSPHIQHQRIRERNGEKMAEMFATQWIPMETAYFKKYQIQEAADVEV